MMKKQNLFLILPNRQKEDLMHLRIKKKTVKNNNRIRKKAGWGALGVKNLTSMRVSSRLHLRHMNPRLSAYLLLDSNKIPNDTAIFPIVTSKKFDNGRVQWIYISIINVLYRVSARKRSQQCKYNS